MVTLGTAKTDSARKMMLLGGGELGKEVVIEAQRLGVEVIVVDRYEYAPAMQVAHRSHVMSMLDGKALRKIVEAEKPDYIVPEIEAIATETLLELEKEGYNVVPTARTTWLTMNREGIRRLAAEEVGLKTSPYEFADTEEDYLEAVKKIGVPFVIKPVMSSSGKGQSIVKNDGDIKKAWDYSQSGGRSGSGRVIVEKFLKFDYEITLLTVRHVDGTIFCEPIGHRQEGGDYRESWQPQPMRADLLDKAKDYAERITQALGGRGIFGVELFVVGDEVLFSEVSPRPHDTGLVTLISQDQSEFALHVRAILGLPVPAIRQYGPAASSVILSNGKSDAPQFCNVEKALAEPDTKILFFGKGECNGVRRLGVALALGSSVEEAKQKAVSASSAVTVSY
ncbi:formate-dependent phosphoribosylglycinamide formyltransferase [Maridesulfovibrio bastinii]|uniref:formate-dependent phosphoribosylglycinamide formyltransferase n=1 Tax=Maridesulfovibrio bastinii TaxID=47157 RepID=UPI0004124341|nr:formate-dependent phosphoribosylglycinamide formyltransferase [Maridesulfovibrio bastinii]